MLLYCCGVNKWGVMLLLLIIKNILKVELYLYIEGSLMFEFMWCLVEKYSVLFFYVSVEEIEVVYNFEDL